ncbi:hypothetical protein PAXRUDRAFT_157423 [Paxillus rubicundulus Ve08.2h10]|uniref:Uncharacterized protein n=1 Tax=Paxillus rubicundulus Ve08.2h10 TaxID=930991 RepID=A0A0D0DPJ8_9AGAM|nr:hypothetical protein PAXRUDRAFT_157423 [Paxillus rubicundulus Ve08.2h10]
MKEHSRMAVFCLFKCQLFHTSLSGILKSLKPGMSKPEVICFCDGHFQCAIYGLGPYIADYKEQVLLSCIVHNWCPKCLSEHCDLDKESLSHFQEHTEALVEEFGPDVLWDKYGIVGQLVPFTNDFCRAEIHRLLLPDLLHQIIKGSFKDHLVDWVRQYLNETYGLTRVNAILDDID